MKLHANVRTERRNVDVGGRGRQDWVELNLNADNKHGTQMLKVYARYDRDTDETHVDIVVPKEWKLRLNDEAVAAMVADRMTKK